MLEGLIYFGIVFILIALIYLLFVNKRRLRRLGIIKSKNKTGVLTDKTVQNLGEVSYVIVKFRLDKAKINFKELFIVTSFINAFIIAFTSMILTMLDLEIIWRLMIGFVILFALVYAIYEIYGRVLVKRGWRK